jgi:hypothetical protein
MVLVAVVEIPDLFLPAKVKTNDVIPKPVDEILVKPAFPALKDNEPVNLAISVSKGTIPVFLAVTPVESKIAFDVCTVPPEVDTVEVPEVVTKLSTSVAEAMVESAVYNGLNNPFTVAPKSKVDVNK